MNLEASAWIQNNYETLVKEYNNKWIGASADGYAGSGESFDFVLREVQERKLPLSKVVFIFLTEEVIQ